MPGPTPRQFAQLRDRVLPARTFTRNARTWLERLGCSHGDPYLVAMIQAEDALHTVWVMSHYGSCEGAHVVPYEPDPGKWLGEGI